MDEHQMKDEALRLALEALEYPGPSWLEARQPAITAIKQALEETQSVSPQRAEGEAPKRKPLTDEEIDALPFPPSGTATLRDFVRIIEAAHGIFANAQNKGEA